MKAVLWILLIGFLITVPHIAEDFVYGVPQKYGVSLTLAGIFVACGYFVQALGMILLSQGRRGGLFVSLLIGLGWLAGAVWDHSRDLINASHYREGAISKFWIAGIVVWGGCLAASSLSALRHASRR